VAMRALNPDLRIDGLNVRADAALLNRLVPTAQVVLDCSDNFNTRQAVNAACVSHRVPLVSGAVIRMDGQLSVYDSRDPASPCYACLFPPDDPPEELRCATLGVLAPLVGVMGTLQATEAVKLLSGLGSTLPGRLQMLDGRRLEWNEMRLTRQPECPVCGGRQVP
jgi:molybdopterin/thiamine biosynthesis adenylyltransferase